LLDALPRLIAPARNETPGGQLGRLISTSSRSNSGRVHSAWRLCAERKFTSASTATKPPTGYVLQAMLDGFLRSGEGWVGNDVPVDRGFGKEIADCNRPSQRSIKSAPVAAMPNSSAAAIVLALPTNRS
jgi:hypothetical protein